MMVNKSEDTVKLWEPEYLRIFENDSVFVFNKDRKLKVVEISDKKTEIVGDSAVKAYLIELDWNVQGKQTTGRCACSSNGKEKGKWVCTMHTETDLAKPAV